MIRSDLMLGRIASIRVIESPHAMAHPKLKEPFTDDMRAMVDVLRARLPAPMRPTAYMMGGMIVAHPSIVAALRAGTFPLQKAPIS